MTLRVAFDARALDLPYLRGQGIGRYTAALLDALGPVCRARDGELIVLRGGSTRSPFAGSGSGLCAGGPPQQRSRTRFLRRPKLPDQLAIPSEQAFLPWDLRRLRATVLHCSSIYRAVPAPGVPWVVSLHDVIPLQFPREYMRTGLMYRLMYSAARRADLILTVSERARRDIVGHLGVAADSVLVVPGAADPRFQPTPVDQNFLAQLGVRQPYVLYVGGLAEHDPRKGVSELIEAFASWSVAHERSEMLVLTGRLGEATAALRAEARASGVPVTFTGFVPDSQLPALYSAATCLVTASHYEGFGLPALEALACGTPMAGYRVGAHEEVAGPGALLVEDGNTNALMLAVQVLADDLGLRARLSVAGRAHAARFSWERSAELTWEAYERVLRNRPGS
jgi:glycosyltransferase involved in cell wall biosynthesis